MGPQGSYLEPSFAVAALRPDSRARRSRLAMRRSLSEDAAVNSRGDAATGDRDQRLDDDDDDSETVHT